MPFQDAAKGAGEDVDVEYINVDVEDDGVDVEAEVVLVNVENDAGGRLGTDCRAKVFVLSLCW